jgi:kinesin family member 22
MMGDSRACKARSVASTNLNRASSRSHAILGITVTYADEMTGTGKYLRFPGSQEIYDDFDSVNRKDESCRPCRVGEQ